MDDELYHHGVKGQKWGVRQYQNEDGTLTKKGRKRLEKQYYTDPEKFEKTKIKLEKKNISEYEKKQEITKRIAKRDALIKAMDRFDMEMKYTDLALDVSGGKIVLDFAEKFVNKTLPKMYDKTIEYIDSFMGEAEKNGFKGG